tara:strand:- start:1133 stop:1444 length:312 start_codon:yes stop_codon:yes gene_type:complete
MTTKNWADMSTYGRYLKRGLSLLVTEIKVEEDRVKQCKLDGMQYAVEDMDRMINIINTISRAGSALTKLADIADHDKRLKNIEFILSKIPQAAIDEAKIDIGN